jgi:REP element-mobilizing transposase RayT
MYLYITLLPFCLIEAPGMVSAAYLRMPRKPRLHAPGLCHHLIVRGIERCAIFCDAEDYDEFLRRLSVLAKVCGIEIYAWCLMPNHIHLLVRPAGDALPRFMSRLLTGYAVYFNRRHHRCGHLFQNRYKSFVVEEEPYFLELVRYIHLNPLRAGLVRTMDELDRWPLSGHAALVGRLKTPFQDTADVLLRFGPHARAARRLYRRFVEERLLQGTREDLQGGGLTRSLGGAAAALRQGKESPKVASDDRVLGLGRFVEAVVMGAGETPQAIRPSIEEIIVETARRWHLTPADLTGPSRKRSITRARREFFARGHHEAGLSLTDLARLCHICPSSVRRLLERATEPPSRETPPWPR